MKFDPDSLPRRHGIKLIPQRNLHESVGVIGGVIERIDHAVHIRQVRIAALARDRVVHRARTDDRLVEIRGVPRALPLVIIEILIAIIRFAIALGHLLIVNVHAGLLPLIESVGAGLALSISGGCELLAHLLGLPIPGPC